MPPTLRLDLNVILPGAPDARDACVSRVIDLLQPEAGVLDAHVVSPPKVPAPMLCVHYDPSVISLSAIEQRVRSWGVTQAEAARRLGITQPRLNDLLRGRITNFSLDTLINLASQAGLTVRLDIAEAA